MENSNRPRTKRKRINGTIAERFWARVEIIPEHTCWEWTGAPHSQGYGVVNIKGKPTFAHRISWELHCGKIPEGKWVLHKCDNRTCVNPAHLFIGTRRDNIDDMVRKGRQAKPRRKIVDGKVVCPRGHEKELLPNETDKYVCRVCMNSWWKRNRKRHKEIQRDYLRRKRATNNS